MLGAPGLSDRYVSGFLWLNKLGTAAASGHSVVIRQTFYHGNYALVNEHLWPNPDFWVSVLFKRLVGERVLTLRGHVNRASTLRLFVHCGKNMDLTLYGLNLSEQPAVITLEPPFTKSTSVSAYVLSAKSQNLRYFLF
jgi:heparanase 1